MNISELCHIENRLKTGDLSWEEALCALLKDGRKRKLWASTEWASARRERILESCEQCGSSEKPLVVQHFWQPRTFTKIFRDVAGDDWTEFKRRYNEQLAESLKVEADVCPTCGSMNLRYQKKLDDWRCQTCQSKCKAPIRGKVLDKAGRALLSWKKKDSFESRLRQFEKEYGAKYGTAAVLIAIGETKRYLSLGDTVTFCKRCAFLWDIGGVRLCVQCGQAFHSINYPVCKSCSVATLEGGDHT